MANLYEITNYKSKLMKLICTSERIAELLHLEGEPMYEGKDLAYRRVFPYLHNPNANETASAFICFDVNVPFIKNDVIKTVNIDINVICNQDIMRLPNGGGMRIDAIAAEVDRLLNGSSEYGIGTVALRSSEGFAAISNYYGRVTRYCVDDFNRNICGDDLIADWA